MAPAIEPEYDYNALRLTLEAASSPAELYQTIVNAPFQTPAQAALIFLGIVVLLLLNEETGTIDRIALSQTMQASGTTEVSVKRFEDIHIPAHDENNIIAAAVRSEKPQSTTDWAYLFTPELTPEQARMNQAGGGIGYSAVYPVSDGHVKGALIFSFFQYPEGIDSAQHEFMERYTALVNESLGRF